MRSLDGARVKFPLKSLIVFLVGLCHWVRSWWPPGAWWDRDSDVHTSSRIFATRGHQESRRAFWRKTRHGTFHGRWCLLLGRRGWWKTWARKPKVSLMLKLIVMYYSDVKSNPTIVTSVCPYMTSWQRSKEITIDSWSTGHFWVTGGNEKRTFCMQGQWSLPNF